MDFFTLCWKKVRARQAALRVCVSLFLLCYLPFAQAQSTLVEINQMQVERNDTGVFFSANLKFELPSLVEDALHKGIPMYFVAEIEVLHDRWYWSDRTIAKQHRYMRLTYQPLTRRWRLNIAPAPIGNSGLGVVLNQNFESLPDALASVQRLSRWRIADSAEIDFDNKTYVDFSFQLDVSQLPRPLQIGAIGETDWNLSGRRNLRLTAESSK